MQKIFFSLLGANLLMILFALFNYLHTHDNNPTFRKHVQMMNLQKSDDIETQNSNNDILNNDPSSYKFDDPWMAYYLLKKLDVFEDGEFNVSKPQSYKMYYFGTTINNNYCDEHRAYFVNNPETIFTKKNFMTDYRTSHRFKNTTIPNIGRDLHPDIGYGMPQKNEKAFYEKLKPELTIFYTNSLMYLPRLVGKHFSCLTQISNHCPGHESLYRKDKVGQALVEYAKQYKARPQCFNTTKLFPETWVMLKPDQCKAFFNRFNSPEYFKLKAERNIVYIRKIGANVHEGNGVFPINDEEEKYVRELYANGTKCGEVTENNIMQAFIHNPLLLNNRKFHFRIFMYIASTNPFIAYYHDGYLRISFQEYDTNSKERGTFVTNLGMTHILFQDKEGVGNRTADQLKEDSYWFYPQFHKYLTEQGLVDDADWVENYLRSEMKQAMVHVIRMAQSGYWKKSSVNELYGIDFVMDDNLNLWFIEANSRPLINGWDAKTTDFFDEMLLDSFEISFGLLRSRAKRITKYINSLIIDKNIWTAEKDNLKNLEEKQEEFRQLTKNRFEPEFEPSREISFYQIIDENREGTKRYFDILKQECL